MENQIIVIYDGECAFCESSIEWIEQRLVIDSKPFQQTDLAKYGLTYQQCSQSVQVITHSTVLAGAPAIAFLLKKRGNRLLSMFISASGPFGRFGYKWIAARRGSRVVFALHQILKSSNSRHIKKSGS
jgi:predicted DCC family thiol-disulfide oxidoreductase YuxK